MPHEHSDNAHYPPLARKPVAARPPVRARDTARPTTGAGENVISHTFVLWVLRQWWMYVVPAGLVLAAAAAAVVMFTYKPKYRATALLMIEDSTPFVAFSDGRTGRDSRRYIQTQVELLRSPVVLEPVISRPEIASMPELSEAGDRVGFLRGRLSVSQIGQSELYNITYTSTSSQDAANVVNAVVAEYMTTHSRDEFQRSQRVVDILEEERRRRSLEVERLRRRVVEVAREVTGRDPFARDHVTDFNRALSPIGVLFRSLTDVDVERELLRARLQSLMDAPVFAEASMESSGLLELQVESHGDIRARQQAIAQLEAQMEEIKNTAIQLKKNPQWEADPTYIALNDERTRRQQDLEEAKTRLREIFLTQLSERRKGEHEAQVARIKQDLDSLETRKELLQQRFAEQLQELQSGGAKSVELEFARAELQREERVFELIASRKLAMQTELRAPARVQLRQHANVPTTPAESIPYRLLMLACSASFAAPFGLAVLRELTVRRISDVEQLAQETGLRVLGEVAALPVRYLAISPRQLSGRLRRDTYVYAESINSLRTNLALADGVGDVQVFAVTSASPGEGKTSISVSLAMSISNASEQSTLVIDGDMRSPAAASMLKTKSQPGLFEVLSRKCRLEDAIHQVGHDGLYVLPAGRATRNTHSVVKMSEIRQLLDKLRRRFSKIVIDTPPILGASESLVLAKAADAVLFCSLCDVSKAKQVRLAIDRLDHAGVNVAGAVLSGTSPRRYEYVYGYYANRIEAS